MTDGRGVRWAGLALLLACCGHAGAQPGASSGFERAQRLAANPMRLILEASKIRLRGAGDAVAAGEVPPAPHPLVPRAANEAAARAATPVGGVSAPAVKSVQPARPDEDDVIRAIVTLPAELPAVVAAADPAVLLRAGRLTAGDMPPVVAPLPELAGLARNLSTAESGLRVVAADGGAQRVTVVLDAGR